MKIVATIQARLGSSRLAGKVLKPILGKPILQWQIERLQRTSLIDEIVVATTDQESDNAIAEFCDNLNVQYYRGSEDDVLDRVAKAVEKYNADVHVECFGDSPLIDPDIINEFIGYLLKHYQDLDFVSNSLKTTYPPGSEVLVYKAKCILEANKMVAGNDPLREHVSPNIYNRKDLFKVKNIEAPPRFHYPELFIEIDTPKDFEMMEKLMSKLYESHGTDFSLQDIIRMATINPEIASLNNEEERRWKEFRKDD